MQERRREQFWLLSDGALDEAAKPKRVKDLPVRTVRREDLLARKVRIENWARIIPYLTADARHADARLQQAVHDRLSKPARLGALEAMFQPIDITALRASLFGLLAAGRVVAPDLDQTSLSVRTMFRRAAT